MKILYRCGFLVLIDQYEGMLVEKKSLGSWDEGFPSLVVLCPHGDKDEEFWSHC